MAGFKPTNSAGERP